MIRVFLKEREDLTSDINTWVVTWTTYEITWTGNIKYPEVKKCYQAFTNETDAHAYAMAINDAMSLIGITSLPRATVGKEKHNSLQ